MSTNSNPEKVLNWIVDFLNCYREEISKLSEKEIKTLQPHNDYRQPCQFEIFWLKEPSMQLIVRTSFKDLEDKEIIINGPYEKHEFNQKVLENLRKPKWQRSEKDESTKHSMHLQESIYADGLANLLHMFIEDSKNFEFQNQSNPLNRFGHGMIFGDLGWAKYFYGNISELDYRLEVQKEIKQIQEDFARNKKQQESPKIYDNSKDPQFEGYGVYFYPPVYVGKKPKRTLEQLLHGNKIDFSLMDKALDATVGEKLVIVNNDGFVSVDNLNKAESLKIINLIMALGIFHLNPFYTVREHELAEVKFDRKYKRTSGFSHRSMGLRDSLFDLHMGKDPSIRHLVREIEPKIVEEIIKEANEIWKNKDVVTKMLLLSESYTHLSNNEFSQSFVMSWSIIEQYISKNWKKLLNEKNIKGARFEKLKQRTVDYELETLNIVGSIPNEQYELISKLKTKRNNFYHSAEGIDKETANLSYGLSQLILLPDLPKEIIDFYSKNLIKG